MLNVKLTPSYRLTSDGTQFIVQQRHVVDPTLAPNWERKQAEAAARGEVLSAAPREEWRDLAYYGMRSDSLILALDFIKLRTVAESDVTTLEAMAALIRELSKEMAAAFREISVEIDV